MLGNQGTETGARESLNGREKRREENYFPSPPLSAHGSPKMAAHYPTVYQSLLLLPMCLTIFVWLFFIFKRKLFSPLPLSPEPPEGLFVDWRISGYKGDHLSCPTGEKSQSPPLTGLPLSGYPLKGHQWWKSRNNWIQRRRFGHKVAIKRLIHLFCFIFYNMMKEKKVTIATDLVLKPALPSYTIYSPILSLPPSLTFCEPPPWVSQVPAIHVFLVNMLLLFLSLLLYFYLIFIIWASPKYSNRDRLFWFKSGNRQAIRAHVNKPSGAIRMSAARCVTIQQSSLLNTSHR